MGCNSSSVVPLGESDSEGSKGIKVRVNPSTPVERGDPDGKGFFIRKSSHTVLESSEPPEELLEDDFNVDKIAPTRPPISFEIPVSENVGGIIKKHPPKRLKRLEELRMDPAEVSLERIDGKQMEAEARRNAFLKLRMKSARHNRKLVHSDAFNHESDEGET